MIPIRFAQPASEEFEAAIRWYEQRTTGLGREFYDAVVAAIDLISVHPEIGTTRQSPPATRHLVLPRFPYQIVYRVKPDDLYVVAVAHTSRRPGYWKGRS